MSVRIINGYTQSKADGVGRDAPAYGFLSRGKNEILLVFAVVRGIVAREQEEQAGSETRLGESSETLPGGA
jgi:hypothetical protein